MPDNVVTTRIVSAHHTAAVWATISTIPKAGEICLETDTLKVKVGNGTDTYVNLPYFNVSAAGHDTVVESGDSTGGVGTIKVTRDGTVTRPSIYGVDTLMPKTGGTFTGTVTLNGAPSSDLEAATKKYVDDTVGAIPKFNIFKGTLGSTGTITALPTAAAANVGFEYMVIEAGTYASQAADVGDLFISAETSTDVFEWVLVPSGDEPSGTVTNIATGAGLTGGPITTTGTIAHSNSVTAVTTETFATFTYDTEGHITGSTAVTIIDGNFS